MGKNIKILIWNIGRLCIPFFPFLDKFFRVSRHSIEKVRAALNDIDADVVMLQEVAGKEHLTELTKNTDYHAILGPSYYDRDYEENTALLSYQKPDDIRHFPENNAVFVSIPELDINAVNVHLQCLNKKRRAKQIEDLISCLPSEKSILAGDFNDDIKKYNLGNFRPCTSELGSTTLYGRHIDDILHTPDVKVESSQIVVRRFGFMDHYPVVANICL